MKSPKHIAIICDGNRRWAKRQGKSEFAGHRHAVEVTVEDLVDHCLKLKISYLTFWFFSTENWQRGKLWTKKFFDLFRLLLPKAQDGYLKKGVRFNHIGDLSALPADLQKSFADWEEKSQKNKKLTATIAFNYGGRNEIIRAIKKFPQGLTLRKLTEEKFAEYLDTHDLPDPDLLIRTGENNTRLSGFMLWQLAYTQLYFTNILFPNLTPQKLDEAISWWQKQTSNLGK
jgi:undecaprenyl diphosphate synthase